MAGVGYAASVPDLPPQVAETDEEAFRGYARDATSRMVTTLCWLLGAAVLVLWPLDWLLFADDPRAREIFLWGRTTFLALTAATLALLRLRAWAQRWSGEIFLFNCAVGCALAGLGCARLGGLELPWYYATYALPALTVPVLMPLGRRVAATLALPLVWSAAFFLSRPAAFEGFALLGIFGFQSATVGGAVAVGHLVYRLTRRDFLAQRLIRRTFGRYFSRDVADALLMSERGELEAEDRVATILFSDLVGYSSLVERLPPGSVIEMLNRYFSAMHEVIRNHHGTVLEYVGDGIMVVFGAPRDLPDHAVHATRCAMEMRAMLAALNHDWQLEGLASLWRDQGVAGLTARIGVHTGRIVAGNLGSASLMKYSVVGDAVNVAARLEALNKTLRTDVLVSETVFRQLPESIRASGRDHGPTALRGRQEEVVVYSL